jgi:FixJ family two-component response regulator
MAAIYSPLPPAVPRFLVVDDEAEIVCPDASFDFRMPHRTGADLLDLVKQRNPKIEVIFLTAG